MTRLPRCNLNAIDELHSDFVRMFRRFEGAELTERRCKLLVRNIEMVFDRAAPDYILQTLLQYSGRTLTPRWCDLLARQLVARHRELEDGLLLPFDEPTIAEWAPMEVYRTEPCLWRDDDPGQFITFYCLAGRPAGHLLVKKFPEGWLAWLAYQIGFSRKLPYEYEPADLVGLRFWGKLLAGLTSSGELDFGEWDIDSQCQKWNARIIRLRKRFDVDLFELDEDGALEYSCPFDHDHYCSDCQRSVHECTATLNRDRTYVGRLVVDAAAAVSGRSRGGRSGA